MNMQGTPMRATSGGGVPPSQGQGLPGLMIFNNCGADLENLKM